MGAVNAGDATAHSTPPETEAETGGAGDAKAFPAAPSAAAAPAPAPPQPPAPAAARPSARSLSATAAFRERQLTCLHQALTMASSPTTSDAIAAPAGTAAAATGASVAPGLPRELVEVINSYLPPSVRARWSAAADDSTGGGVDSSSSSMRACWDALPSGFPRRGGGGGGGGSIAYEVTLNGNGINAQGTLLPLGASTNDWAVRSVDHIRDALHEHCARYATACGERAAVRFELYAPKVLAFVAHVRELVDDWRGTVYLQMSHLMDDRPRFMVVLDDGEPDDGIEQAVAAAAALPRSGTGGDPKANPAVRALVPGVSIGLELLLD